MNDFDEISRAIGRLEEKLGRMEGKLDWVLGLIVGLALAILVERYFQ